MFGSGFRSVTGEFLEPAVFGPQPRKGKSITGADPGYDHLEEHTQNAASKSNYS
jgi:hypothetical protein